MPYIHAQTNMAVTPEKEERMKTRFGQAVSNLGKTESYLMVRIEDQCHLYFHGDGQQPIAFVEVKLFGKASNRAYDAMTEAVTEIVSEELGIPGRQIYVQYQEVPHWGYNGSNF